MNLIKELRLIVMVIHLLNDNSFTYCTSSIVYHEIALHIKEHLDDPLKTVQAIAGRHDFHFFKRIFPKSNYYLLYKTTDNCTYAELCTNTTRKFKRSLDTSVETSLLGDTMVDWVQIQKPKVRVKRSSVKAKTDFNDPLWPRMWYINPKEKHSSLMRIKDAWQSGYTGKGVVVTILDDGIERDHPDLIKNFDYSASLDINDNDNDPKPRYDRYNYNKHGTRCAGEIAAAADNHVCSIGVAFNARIGGIRMLDGDVTDLVEATALSFNRDYIDIYSASWGPDDDGKTVDGPGHLTIRAIEDGVKYGRRGLGSIFVWASGNGGKDSDNCNCDGYTNSIYTISISSASQHGHIPWYSESCSSTLASTYSSGSYNERQIVTTDLRKSCTESHTGTSASAPIAAGIIALTLEANRGLTWRDIQHIIVRTAKQHNLLSMDWIVNGANRTVSHSFGFGLMDALAMVDLAKKWQTIPSQRKCIVETKAIDIKKKNLTIPKNDYLVLELMSNGCKDTNNEINYIEHIQSVLSIDSSSRGGLAIFLTSPMGTTSTLLDLRERDKSMENFDNWPFTTVHMWGETPQGKWTLKIKNQADSTTFLNWDLIIYGTKENPYKRSASKSQFENTMRNSKFKMFLNSSTVYSIEKTTRSNNLVVDFDMTSSCKSKYNFRNTYSVRFALFTFMNSFFFLYICNNND